MKNDFKLLASWKVPLWVFDVFCKTVDCYRKHFRLQSVSDLYTRYLKQVNRWSRHVGCGDLWRPSRGGTNTWWGSSSSSRWRCWHGSHLSRSSRRDCSLIRHLAEGFKSLGSWLAARNKDDVSAGNIRKHRLDKGLAPGLLYMGVGGTVRLLMLSELSLYTQGWFFFGIFVVCHTTLLPLGSWYIAFFSRTGLSGSCFIKRRLKFVIQRISLGSPWEPRLLHRREAECMHDQDTYTIMHASFRPIHK